MTAKATPREIARSIVTKHLEGIYCGSVRGSGGCAMTTTYLGNDGANFHQNQIEELALRTPAGAGPHASAASAASS